MAPERIKSEMRQELGSILDDLAALPPDAFHERSALLARKQQLSDHLRAVPIQDADDLRAQWSKRAGKKPDQQHEIKPVIVSPNESGSAGV